MKILTSVTPEQRIQLLEASYDALESIMKSDGMLFALSMAKRQRFNDKNVCLDIAAAYNICLDMRKKLIADNGGFN